MLPPWLHTTVKLLRTDTIVARNSEDKIKDYNLLTTVETLPATTTVEDKSEDKICSICTTLEALLGTTKSVHISEII